MASVGESFTFPCGQTVKNRLCKSAMTEGLGDEHNRATEGHVNLYRAWSMGGTGLLITGNVQVDRRYMERPGNVAIDGPQDEEQLRRLCAFAAAAQQHGTRCWVQLGHAGRQCDALVNLDPVGPSTAEWWSEVPPPGRMVRPRMLTVEQIDDVKARFVYAARVCKDCGFSGVQLHSAHGYLLSSFLNPRANTRTDAYGGSLENRARLLLETVKAIREAVGQAFPIGVKINSADFQKGGFTFDESQQVAKWLDDAGLDLLELSGGNYEQPSMMLGPEARRQLNKSTVLREAYFMEFARQVRPLMKRTPVMVTGGIRSRDVMDRALRDRDCDMIGIGRPLCGDPACSAKLLRGEEPALPMYERTLRLPLLLRFLMYTPLGPKIRFGGQQMWYYAQERNMGAGRPVNHSLSIVSALTQVMREDAEQAAALQGLSCVGMKTNAPPSSSKMRLIIGVVLLLGGILLARRLITK